MGVCRPGRWSIGCMVFGSTKSATMRFVASVAWPTLLRKKERLNKNTDQRQSTGLAAPVGIFEDRRRRCQAQRGRARGHQAGLCAGDDAV